MPLAFARIGFHSSRSLRAKLQRGFTLIEIMVVVAIVGILASVAIPSYSDYIIRSNLVEATNALSDQRTRMEQFYADNRSYAAAGGACGATLLILDNFTLTCATGGAGQTYTITALGKASSNVKNFTYTINNANARTTTWGDAWGGTVPTGGATKWVMKR